MRLTKQGVLSTAAAFALVAGSLGGASAAEPAKKKAAPVMDEKAMMEAWQAHATPGEPHKQLEKFAGSWTATSRMWMAPGAPPAESAGTADMKMVLGGRWLEQRFEGKLMEQPLHGMGYTGYDNYKKKYVSNWMDDMSTSMMTTEGTMEKDGTLSASGKMDDFVMKKTVPVKTAVKWADADTMTYEMWCPGPDGKMFKTLEVAYKRKK